MHRPDEAFDTLIDSINSAFGRMPWPPRTLGEFADERFGFNPFAPIHSAKSWQEVTPQMLRTGHCNHYDSLLLVSDDALWRYYAPALMICSIMEPDLRESMMMSLPVLLMACPVMDGLKEEEFIARLAAYDADQIAALRDFIRSCIDKRNDVWWSWSGSMEFKDRLEALWGTGNGIEKWELAA